VLIHLSGGIESPFLFFYLFHAIFGSVLLSRTEAGLLGLVAFLLFLLLVGLEYTAVLHHHHVWKHLGAARHRSPPYVIAVAGTLLTTLTLAIYMTSELVRSLHIRQRESVVAQNLLQKESRALQDANRALREQQEQLVQTEKLASIGQLASGIAHEINNPMQFVHGNIQILQEAIADALPILDERAKVHPELTIARLKYPFFREQVAVLLKDMLEGTVRIRAIVNDLRTFARRDEGRLDEAVDLNELVEASRRLLHNRLKKHEVVLSLDPRLPQVTGNKNQLEQVLVNTLVNAADALADTAHGVIRIETKREENGREVRLSVSDNGVGITAETKRRMFDPFFSTKQRSGGTGLGLSITYGIVQRHGGRIEVDSEPGKGATFHFVLPFARSCP
jgi:polar amino acid transport system substrate-binding protein